MEKSNSSIALKIAVGVGILVSGYIGYKCVFKKKSEKELARAILSPYLADTIKGTL